MSDAQTILKLIETVDPGDNETLDKIDKAVDTFYWNGTDQFVLPPFYTRSRDALKAIRPDDATFSINKSEGFWVSYLTSCKKEYQVSFWYGKTEELAELHAIIQAIAHERGQ